MSDTRSQKYIVIDNVLTLNPNYQASTGIPQSAAPPVPNQMAVVSTMEDQMAAAGLTQMPLPTAFMQAMSKIQSQSYVDGFQSTAIDGGTLIDGLSNLFGQYEIPIGLMNKLTVLQGAVMHFKIDDSGSMGLLSNMKAIEACPYMKNIMPTGRLNDPRYPFLTRWEEAEDRLHIIVDLLAYVPTGPVILSFFDRPSGKGQGVTLERVGRAPTDFLAYAHGAVRDFFSSKRPGGGTPTLLNMRNMLASAEQMRGSTDMITMHYLLTDGEPDGGATEINGIKDFLLNNRPNSKNNPFTFLVCSNDSADYEWMHETEEVAFGKHVAVLNEYREERKEVGQRQGFFFPYSRGFWVLSNVVAALNPNDLDALDQFAPLTKPTLEELMGRTLTDDEYLKYWTLHPTATRAFQADYLDFKTKPYAINIASVQFFDTTLANILSQDMNDGEDDSELRAERTAEAELVKWRAQSRNYGRNTLQYGGIYSNSRYSSQYGSSTSSNNSNRQRFG